MKIGFIFPGQGSQASGMGYDLYQNSPAAKAVYDRADSVLGRKISELCFFGEEDELKKTINAQSAIVTTSLAALAAFKAKCGIEANAAMGHSLGEYCAMYAAGVMDLDTTIRAIQKRSEAMDEATKKSKGAMAAILGSSEETIQECLSAASELGVAQIANYNDPNQIVITGEEEAILKASELIREKGAKRVVPLAVSGGFHSKLMDSAAEEFRKYIPTLNLNDAKIPVITNVDAKFTTSKEDFILKMPNQINSSVMWRQSVQNALNKGISTFIEFGNGKILAGMNRKISSEIATYNVFDMASLDETASKLSEMLMKI